MRLGMMVIALLIVVMVASASRVVAGARYEAIEILGWDQQTQRIYYLDTRPWFDPRTPGDSMRTLMYFDTSDSVAQQPHELLWSRDRLPEFALRLRNRVDSLRTRLSPMQVRPLPRIHAVQGMNERSVLVEDYIDCLAEYRWDYQGLSGTVTGYCAVDMVVRMICLAPNERDGLAIVSVSENPVLALLISKSTHAPRRLRGDHQW